VTLNLAVLKYDLVQNSNTLKITNQYTYDFEKHQLLSYDNVIKLTHKESKLLTLLVSARGNIVPYEDIDTIVWTESIVTDDSRRQLFHRLKNKLQNFPFELIKGTGYKINI